MRKEYDEMNKKELLSIFLMLLKKKLRLEQEKKFSEYGQITCCNDEKIVGFSIKKKKLEEIPKEVWELTSLKRLVIGRNNIKRIDERLSRFKNLEVLEIATNPIESLPESIGELRKLKRLILVNTKIGSLPCSIKKLESLTYFRLVSINKEFSPEVFDILKDISSLKNLEVLELEVRQGFDIPLVFNNLHHLKKLKITFSKITGFEKIDGLINLEELDISFCHGVEYLSENFGKLKKLRVLNIGSSNLRELPKSIGECSSLKELHLWNNNLQRLPDSMENLSSLQLVEIDDNPWVYLPKKILKIDRDRYESFKKYCGFIKDSPYRYAFLESDD